MAVKHCTGCSTEICNNPRLGCLNQEVLYPGAVLDLVEYNGGHDSDFYALCWDAEKQTVAKIWYATTSSWTFHNSAKIDATEEVRAAAMDWMRREWTAYTVERRTIEWAIPCIGAEVRSLTTRGKNVGVTGTVRYVDDRARYGKVRIGVCESGTGRIIWLDRDRAEIINPAVVDVDEVREAAEKLTLRDIKRYYTQMITNRTAA